MTPDEKVQLVVSAADSKQARDPVLLDLRGRTLMTDFFFICSGGSSTHVRTISDAVVETMKRNGYGGIRVEGYDSAQWVLMDYGDVVVHIMNPEQREYYGLEKFWKEAPRISLPEPTPST